MGGEGRRGRRRRRGGSEWGDGERVKGMYNVCGLVESWYCMEFSSSFEASLELPVAERFLNECGAN